MNTIQLIICYPGGNINGIVANLIDRIDQPYVAEEILQSYNKGRRRDDQIEQIGFIEKPIDPQAVSRLQMSGGEFSGNAALCLSEIILAPNTTRCIEVSGTTQLMTARKYSDNYVSSQMPIPRQLKEQYTLEKLPMIQMDGITHIIVNSAQMKSEKEQRTLAMQIISRNGFSKFPATGILFITQSSENTTMIPYIYFRKGQQYELVKETSCGSGSVAVAITSFRKQNRQSIVERILQPSGCELFVTVENTNSTLSCQLKGIVKILYRSTYPIVYNLDNKR